MNENVIERKIARLSKDMGKSKFLKLVDFMVKILESPYEIKVFMMRRFYDLYLALTDDIISYLYEDELPKIRGEIMTNLSIVLLEKDLKGKKILIVDDIMLHGRALREVGNYLLRHGVDEKDIDLQVFLRNEKSKIIKGDILKKVLCEKKVNTNQWRNLSNDIINLFYITGQPYVSYLPYCEIQFEDGTFIFEFVKTTNLIEMTSNALEYYHIRSYLYLMDQEDEFVLQKKLEFVEQNMIRIYVYEELSKIVIVPYAFLKPMNSDSISAFYLHICSQKNIHCHYNLDFLTDSTQLAESEEKERFAYALLTYMVSLSIGKFFLKNRGITDCDWSKKIEYTAFRVEIEENAVCMEKILDAYQAAAASQEKKVFYAISKSEFEHFEGISEIVECVKKHINQEKSSAERIERIIGEYIRCSDRRDEERVKEDKDRGPGISARQLLEEMKDFEQRPHIWAKVIKLVDSGRGTLSIRSRQIGEQKYMDSLLYAGEQSFSSNEKNAKYYIYPFLQYELACEKKQKDAAQIQRGKQELKDLISQKYPHLSERVAEDELKQLVIQNISDGYKDYYLKRYDMYDRDPQLREVMELECEYQQASIT